jgi:CopG family nickel-responsive transcriptional regulator
LGSENVFRFSVSAPQKLVEEFDTTIKKIGYDRSKAIQTAMRSFLDDYKLSHDVKDDVRGLEEGLTDIQHIYQNIISSTTHLHLDKHHCLEIIAVKGDAKLARKLSEEIMKKRGVKQNRLVVTTIAAQKSGSPNK